MSNLESSEFNIQTSEISNTRHKGDSEGFKSRAGAFAIAVTLIISGNLGDNNIVRSKEQIIYEDTSSLSKIGSFSTEIEKKAPKIIADNQPIFEFLEGNMGKYDTLESMHVKLKKELDQKITENQTSDDFSYTLGIELLYRQTNNKSKGELLGRTIQQLETEKRTLQYLDNFFHTLDVSSVQDMNYGIFTYHNQIGTNKLDPKNIESIKQALEEERRNLGYTYNDLMKWKDQYEKQASKKVHPTIKR